MSTANRGSLSGYERNQLASVEKRWKERREEGRGGKTLAYPEKIWGSQIRIRSSSMIHNCTVKKVYIIFTGILSQVHWHVLRRCDVQCCELSPFSDFCDVWSATSPLTSQELHSCTIITTIIIIIIIIIILERAPHFPSIQVQSLGNCWTVPHHVLVITRS